jgi:hypothetical protein
MFGDNFADSLAKRNISDKVYFATRDPLKTIPDFNEKSSSTEFESIQAHLSKPEELKDAIAKTGVPKAFIYALFSDGDHMSAAGRAEHAGGIRFLVFNTFITVRGDRSKLSSQKVFVAWACGMIKRNILDTMGLEGLVALRSGLYNTYVLIFRSLKWPKGDVKILYLYSPLKWIALEDIGAIAAHFHVEGTQPATESLNAEKDGIYVVGLQLLSLQEGLLALDKAHGKSSNVISTR